MISELTGLEISNASVYDGASAVAEAALMTARQTKRDPKVAVSAGLNPRYREVIETYRVEVVELPLEQWNNGLLGGARRTSPGSSCRARTTSGSSRTWERRRRRRTRSGRCAWPCATRSRSPCSKRPGNLGADVAVGEAQPLGMPLLFGGPYAGYMATRREVRPPAPGRIAGETVDTGRQARLRPDAAGARAGHPAGEGELEHLHQPGAHGPRRDRLRLAHGAGGAARGGGALRSPRRTTWRRGFGRRASSSVIRRRRSCGSSRWRCRTWGGPTRRCWRPGWSAGWTSGTGRCSSR